MIDLLQGRDRPELSSDRLAASVPFFREGIALAQQRGLKLLEPSDTPDMVGGLATPDRIVADIRAKGQTDLSAALNNGLSREENEELFRSVDPWRIAELVLTGLSRRS